MECYKEPIGDVKFKNLFSYRFCRDRKKWKFATTSKLDVLPENDGITRQAVGFAHKVGEDSDEGVDEDRLMETSALDTNNNGTSTGGQDHEIGEPIHRSADEGKCSEIISFDINVDNNRASTSDKGSHSDEKQDSESDAEVKPSTSGNKPTASARLSKFLAASAIDAPVVECMIISSDSGASYGELEQKEEQNISGKSAGLPGNQVACQSIQPSRTNLTSGDDTHFDTYLREERNEIIISDQAFAKVSSGSINYSDFETAAHVKGHSSIEKKKPAQDDELQSEKLKQLTIDELTDLIARCQIKETFLQQELNRRKDKASLDQGGDDADKSCESELREGELAIMVEHYSPHTFTEFRMESLKRVEQWLSNSQVVERLHWHLNTRPTSPIPPPHMLKCPKPRKFAENEEAPTTGLDMINTIESPGSQGEARGSPNSDGREPNTECHTARQIRITESITDRRESSSSQCGPNTLQHGPYTLKHGPNTLQYGPNTLQHVPFSAHGPNTSQYRPFFAHGPNTSQYRPFFAHGPNNLQHGPFSAHGPNTSQHRPFFAHGPNTSQHRPFFAHGPNTLQYGTNTLQHRPLFAHGPNSLQHGPNTLQHVQFFAPHRPNILRRGPKLYRKFFQPEPKRICLRENTNFNANNYQHSSNAYNSQNVAKYLITDQKLLNSLKI